MPSRFALVTAREFEASLQNCVELRHIGSNLPSMAPFAEIVQLRRGFEIQQASKAASRDNAHNLIIMENTPPDGRHQDDYAHIWEARRATMMPPKRWLQPPPVLFNPDGLNVFLGDLYKGWPCFLVCGGPSLAETDLAPLEQPGILTCAVNNAAVLHRPRLWVCADDPGNFHEAIWYDPGVLKFVPTAHFETMIQVRRSDGSLVEGARVHQLPGVLGFRRNERFDPVDWLTQDSLNWGAHAKIPDPAGEGGGRSVLFLTLKLLYYLGVRTVYLIGSDFKMDAGEANYAFAQDRTDRSVQNNNRMYALFNRRMEMLQPSFAEAGFRVVNCTPDSGLTVFEHLSLLDALAEAIAPMPVQRLTRGMYDRADRIQKTVADKGIL